MGTEGIAMFGRLVIYNCRDPAKSFFLKFLVHYSSRKGVSRLEIGLPSVVVSSFTSEILDIIIWIVGAIVSIKSCSTAQNLEQFKDILISNGS